MLNYSKVIENSAAIKTIELDISRSRISHAYLFVSKDKKYLKQFAETVAIKLININETEFAEKNSLRIKKRTHPDVSFFGEDKAISAEVATGIVESSSITPFEADKKIFVIENFQKANESAQNKLLKTIEEPAKNTIYILCATATSKILQTILSRVKKIDLDELSKEDIKNMLIETGIKQEKAEVLSSCANGDGEFAEKLATDDGFVDFFNNIVSCLFEINGSRDVLKFSSMFTAKSVDQEEFINLVQILLRDIMMLLSGKEDLVVCKHILPKLKVISSSLNLSAVQILIETCFNEKKKLSFNVNSTAVIDDFLFKLAEVKVKCRRLSV